MKILHIHDRIEAFGGGEVYLSQVREGLSLRGHDNSVLYLTPGGADPVSETAAVALKKPIGVLSGIRMGRRLIEHLDRHRPDLIHLHTLFSPVLVSRLLARWPTVFTLHSLHLLPRRTGHEPLSPIGLYDRVLRIQMRYVLQGLDQWIAPSSAFAEEIRSEGVARERITVLPHFTELDAAGAPETAEATVILFVGRLSPEKGVVELIETLRLLRAGAWRAMIVGEGPLYAVAADLVARYGLADRVRFAGRLEQPALSSAYRRAALVVVPSMVKEAFSLVGIEAMAHAKPVAAFDAGGVREWLADGVNGIMAPQGDVPALAKAIQHLLDHPDRAREMGTVGRRMVDERFRRSAHLDQLVALYEAAIARRRMRAA